METVKVDIQKLQLLNDRIAQTIEAVNQLRMSAYGIQHSPVSPYGYGTPYGGGYATPSSGFAPQFGSYGVPYGSPYGTPTFATPTFATPGYPSPFVPGLQHTGTAFPGAFPQTSPVGNGISHTAWDPSWQSRSTPTWPETWQTRGTQNWPTQNWPTQTWPTPTWPTQQAWSAQTWPTMQSWPDPTWQARATQPWPFAQPNGA